MKVHAKAAATVLAAATVVLAAGCGGSSGMAASQTPTASQSAGGSSAAPAAVTPAAVTPAAVTPAATAQGNGGSTASAGSSGTQAQRPGRCHTSMLSAVVTLGNPGAGQRYAFLVLTNTSGVTCQVSGYPGMQLANASSQPIVTKVSRVAATPRLVTLTPGQRAYTLLHWTIVPGTSETPATCEPVPSVLLVTPPDETATLRTSWPGGNVCQHGMIDVTPFKPGTGA